MNDLLAALLPVVGALRQLGVRHFVGGSFASSAHGIGRASLDVDLIAELSAEQVAPLVAALGDAYYIDAERVAAAVARRGTFNAVHLATMMKIDVFVARGRPIDEEALRRARPALFSASVEEAAIPVASAEDIVLAKLEWYRAGGEVSERQWSDVIGVLAMRRDTLDLDYLRRWSQAIDVTDLLERALARVGRPSDG